MTEARLRILMLAPTAYFTDRGCLVRIYEEARALRSQGHDVRIVTYHLGRDMPGIPTIRIPRIPWYSRVEAGPSWHKLYLDLLLLGRALLLAPEFRPHLIHAHLHEGAFIGWFLKKLSRLPLVLDYQGSLTGECIDHGFFAAGSRLARLFRRIESMIQAGADRILTSSGSGATGLTGSWGVPTQRVIPLIDAVDTDIFHPAPQDEGRNRLGIAPDAFVVAYLGLLNRYQGTELLLECIEKLKRDGVRALFLIMGFPDERYRAAAEARGLGEMVIFTGKVDYSEAPLLLAAADIAVTPKLSLTEANGKIFNYMACGLPVVAFDTPVNREVLGDSGVYAPYGDPDGLADRIAALATDGSGRRRLAEQVREKALQEHSWDSRGRQLVQIYRDLLAIRP